MSNGYEKLETDDCLEHQRTPSEKRNKKLSSALPVFLGLLSLFLFSILAFIGVYYFNFHSSTTKASSTKWLDCGHSPEEARFRGCSFDVMSFTWSMPDCFDAELMAQFLKHRDWHWYTEDSTEVLKPDVLAGDYEYLFVSIEYHLVHCSYMWRKMHRAVLSGRKIDSYLGSFNHTLHCERRMHSYDALHEKGDVNTVIVTKYPTCGLSSS